MSLIDDLIPLLKKLRLSGILETLDLRKKEAVDDELGHAEFLYRLLSDEVERREAKQLGLRLRRASFDHGKTLEDFDFRFNDQVPKALVLDLATCAFIDKRENILFVGQAGVGKSHLAQALGHRACRAGHKVLFTGAQAMLKELRASRGDGTYDRRLLRFTAPDLLIIDDLGLRPLRGDEPMDLYEVIRGRYERGATSPPTATRTSSAPSSATRSSRAPPWIGSSITRTSWRSRAPATETPNPAAHAATRRRTERRLAHDCRPKRSRSLWPSPGPHPVRARSGVHEGEIGRITLAVPRAIWS